MACCLTHLVLGFCLRMSQPSHIFMIGILPTCDYHDVGQISYEAVIQQGYLRC